MDTKVITVGESDTYASELAEASRALRAGALVVFPTETVYGVAANLADATAMQRLRRVKGRGDQQPFTVHLGSRSEARRYVPSASPLARRLARKLWPGPVTLIVEVAGAAQSEVARSIAPEQQGELYHNGTVGLRCPDHAVAQRLLSEAGVPIVASSANRAGQPPPFDLTDAMRDLRGEVDYAIDGGRTRYAAASTIVEVRGNAWSIKRTGVYDERTIRRLARSEILFVCTGNSCRSPLAEYMFRHKLAARLGCPVDELAEQGYHVSSAGTYAPAGGRASTGTVDELARRGIDARGHLSQPLTIELIQRAERIYAMTPEHRAAVLDLAPSAASRVELMDPRGAVSDPVGGGPEDYERCAAHIEKLIDQRIEELLHEDRDW